eukprot:403358478
MIIGVSKNEYLGLKDSYFDQLPPIKIYKKITIKKQNKIAKKFKNIQSSSNNQLDSILNTLSNPVSYRALQNAPNFIVKSRLQLHSNRQSGLSQIKLQKYQDQSQYQQIQDQSYNFDQNREKSQKSLYLKSLERNLSSKNFIIGGRSNSNALNINIQDSSFINMDQRHHQVVYSHRHHPELTNINSKQFDISQSNQSSSKQLLRKSVLPDVKSQLEMTNQQLKSYTQLSSKIIIDMQQREASELSQNADINLVMKNKNQLLKKKSIRFEMDLEDSSHKNTSMITELKDLSISNKKSKSYQVSPNRLQQPTDQQNLNYSQSALRLNFGIQNLKKVSSKNQLMSISPDIIFEAYQTKKSRFNIRVPDYSQVENEKNKSKDRSLKPWNPQSIQLPQIGQDRSRMSNSQLSQAAGGLLALDQDLFDKLHKRLENQSFNKNNVLLSKINKESLTNTQSQAQTIVQNNVSNQMFRFKSKQDSNEL